MPRISETGNTVFFKSRPQYFSRIKEGKVFADIREVDSKWRAICEYAREIIFEHTESKEVAGPYTIRAVYPLSIPFIALKNLIPGVSWLMNGDRIIIVWGEEEVETTSD